MERSPDSPLEAKALQILGKFVPRFHYRGIFPHELLADSDSSHLNEVNMLRFTEPDQSN
jgi:hypothetical protein